MNGTALSAVKTASRAAPSGAAAASWPELGGDPGHTGFDPAETAIGTQNASVARIAWEATGPGFSEAEPTVASGLAFIAGGSKLTAVRTTDGTSAWSASGSFRAAAPTIIGDTVVAGDQEGVLHAYQLATGTPEWSKTVGTQLPALTAWSGAVAASTSAGKTVVVLHAASGGVSWRRSVRGEVSGTAEGSNVLVVTDSLGEVYGFNAATGASEWERTLRGGARGAPTVYGDSVYAPAADLVTALALSSGKARWTYTGAGSGSDIDSRIATDGKTVLVGLNVGTLVALSASTGQQIWSAAAGPYVQVGTAAIADGVAWVCNSSLVGFNVATGVQVADIAIPTLACNSSDPAIAGDAVYATVLNLDNYTHLIAVRIPKITRYVAFGDSIPYGHGLANPDKKREGGLPPDMGPSGLAYPSLIARFLGVKMALRKSGCALAGDNLTVSGAPAIDNKWTGLNTNCHYSRTVPPHQAVDPDELNAASLKADPPQLVTIQAGADDIDFAGCLTRLLGIPKNPFTDSVKCIDVNQPGNYSLPSRVSTELRSLASGLGEIISTVHAEAPAAEIVVVDYYQPVPRQSEALTGSSTVCRLLRASQKLGNLSQQRAEADYLQARLNDTVRDAAEAHSYVKFVNISSLFSGHEMCVADPHAHSRSSSWLFDGVWDAAHPIKIGQEQIAQALEPTV